MPGYKAVAIIFTALCILAKITVAEGSGITLCPGSYDKVLWNDCLGIYTFSDGTKYIGKFANNKFHGWGALVWRSKGTCVGFFERGKIVGRCLLQKPKKKKDRHNENRNIFANPI